MSVVEFRQVKRWDWRGWCQAERTLRTATGEDAGKDVSDSLKVFAVVWVRGRVSAVAEDRGTFRPGTTADVGVPQ